MLADQKNSFFKKPRPQLELPAFTMRTHRRIYWFCKSQSVFLNCTYVENKYEVVKLIN